MRLKDICEHILMSGGMSYLTGHILFNSEAAIFPLGPQEVLSCCIRASEGI